MTRSEPQPVLEIDALTVRYELKTPLIQRLLGKGRRNVRAVQDVSFDLGPGEVIGIIGESGSGKSTLGRTIVGLAPITGGRVRVNGVDVSSVRAGGRKALARTAQMVFQDPHASLPPTMTLGEAIGDPLRIHEPRISAQDRERRVHEVLTRVGLEPAAEFAAKHPGDLSGGQKQRAVIARAVILDPVLVVADEPVSALDMSVRAKVLSLLDDLRRRGISFIYITHDLASARFFCDRIAIMYLGRVVEYGPVEKIFRSPQHPYTRALLDAIPDVSKPAGMPRTVLAGEVADAVSPPRGCSFHPRCPVATPVCGWESRDLSSLLDRFWTTLAVDDFTRLQSRIAEVVAHPDQPDTAVVRAAHGNTAQSVTEVLELARAALPDARIWGAVEEMTPHGNDLWVRLTPSIPLPRPVVDDVVVECVLPESARA